MDNSINDDSKHSLDFVKKMWQMKNHDNKILSGEARYFF